MQEANSPTNSKCTCTQDQEQHPAEHQAAREHPVSDCRGVALLLQPGNVYNLGRHEHPTSGGHLHGLGHDKHSESDTYHSRLAAIERLPPEIRHHIFLQIDDVESLFNLRQASPTYYLAYYAKRDFWVVRRCLLGLGRVLPEAYTVSYCNSPSFRSTRTLDEARDLIAKYKHARSVPMEQLRASVGEARRISIARFYLSTIRPLVLRYCEWVSADKHISRLAGEERRPRGVGAKNMSVKRWQLSETEHTRIMRGLYRYQLYHNLFGPRLEGDRWGSAAFTGPVLEDDERNTKFILAHEYWEIEEMLCISRFVAERWWKALDETEEAVSEDHWRRANPHVPEEPENRFDLFEVDRGICGFPVVASQGLTPLPGLLRALSAGHHDQLVEMSVTALSQVNGYWETSLDESVLELATDVGFHGDQQLSRELMPFEGDSPDTAPYAWVQHYGAGTRPTVRGRTSTGCTERDRGWVMWDAPRITGCNVDLDKPDQYDYYNG